MDKYVEVWSQNGILDSHGNKQSTTTCSSMDVPQIYYLEQNKLDSNAHILLLRFFKIQKYLN